MNFLGMNEWRMNQASGNALQKNHFKVLTKLIHA